MDEGFTRLRPSRIVSDAPEKFRERDGVHYVSSKQSPEHTTRKKGLPELSRGI